MADMDGVDRLIDAVLAHRFMSFFGPFVQNLCTLSYDNSCRKASSASIMCIIMLWPRHCNRSPTFQPARSPLLVRNQRLKAVMYRYSNGSTALVQQRTVSVQQLYCTGIKQRC